MDSNTNLFPLINKKEKKIDYSKIMIDEQIIEVKAPEKKKRKKKEKKKKEKKREKKEKTDKRKKEKKRKRDKEESNSKKKRKEKKTERISNESKEKIEIELIEKENLIYIEKQAEIKKIKNKIEILTSELEVNPKNIEVWIDRINLEEQIDKLEDKDLKIHSQNLIDKQIHLYERAIVENPFSEKLIISLLSLYHSSPNYSFEYIQKKYQFFLKINPNSFSILSSFFNYLFNNFSISHFPISSLQLFLKQNVSSLILINSSLNSTSLNYYLESFILSLIFYVKHFFFFF